MSQRDEWEVDGEQVGVDGSDEMQHKHIKWPKDTVASCFTSRSSLIRLQSHKCQPEVAVNMCRVRLNLQ